MSGAPKITDEAVRGSLEWKPVIGFEQFGIAVPGEQILQLVRSRVVWYNWRLEGMNFLAEARIIVGHLQRPGVT